MFINKATSIDGGGVICDDLPNSKFPVIEKYGWEYVSVMWGTISGTPLHAVTIQNVEKARKIRCENLDWNTLAEINPKCRVVDLPEE